MQSAGEQGSDARTNPVVVASALIVERNLILIGRKPEGDHPAGLGGKWVLPGGHVENGESLSDALLREVLEETGLHVLIEESMGEYTDIRLNGSTKINYFLCRPITTEARAGDDLQTLRWVKPAQALEYFDPHVLSMFSTDLLAWLQRMSGLSPLIRRRASNDMIKGVFFDLYGTLLIYDDLSASKSAWVSAFYRNLNKYDPSITEDYLASCYDDIFERAIIPDNDELTLYEHRIKAFCDDLGLQLSEENIHRIADETVRAWQGHVTLDPEALPVLQELKTQKTLALISNFDHPPHLHAILAELGLTEYFSTILVSGDIGINKPDPRIFAKALDDADLQAGEVIFVGDSVKDDIRGSHAAGIHPVLIRREPVPKNPGTDNVIQYVRHPSLPSSISNLTELLEI